MAKFNEILVGRYNRYLQKLLQLKGSAPAPQLASEIGIGIELFHGYETVLHQGWTRWAARGTPVGVAAQSTGFGIRNPATSNVIAVVEKCVLTDNNGAKQFLVICIGPSLVDFTTIFAASPLDPRQGQAGSQCVVSQTQNAVGTPTNVLTYIIADGASIDVVQNQGQEFVIAPGYEFAVFSSTQNATLNCSAVWRERFLEDSERS